MTAEACREHVGDLAAEALGQIDAGTALRLHSHLDGCAGCRGELAELRRAVAALRLADTDRVTDETAPPALLGDRIVDAVGIARKQRRRRRWLAGASGAAAVAMAVGVTLLALGPAAGDDPSAGNGRSAVAFTVVPTGGEAGAILVEQGWGTEVRLDVTGLDEDEVYWLWLSSDDGQRVAAGTFSGTGRQSQLVLASALPFHEVRRVWATDRLGGVVLDTRDDP